MGRDPRGYYKRLGLLPGATDKQIKNAFRKLAKKHHPDLSPELEAKRTFQLIAEAYEVLSNVNARAKYDSSGYDTETVEQTQQNRSHTPSPEPIKCSFCGKATAQPKYLVFWNIISLILISLRNPIQGIFCKQCADRIALKASFISALLGWWSIHGLFLTPIVIFRNALGGQQDNDNNEKLAFANATIFFRRGQYDLAYALAKPLRMSAVDRFNEGARFICQIIEREQLADTSRQLRDIWRFNSIQFAKNVALGTVMPAVLLCAFFYNDIERYFNPKPNWSVVSRPPLDTAGLTPAPERPAPRIQDQIAVCNPSSGTILGGYYKYQTEGHSIKIRNGTDNAAVVKLRDSNNRTYVSFYVKKHSFAQVPGLRDGHYKVQFAAVSGLSTDCRGIAKILGTKEFPNLQSLTTKYGGGYVEWTELSLTLHAVAGGNIRTKNIEVGAFAND